MSRTKVFASILMVLILIALSGASVWAAPGRDEPTPTPTETPTPEPTETPTPEPTEEPTVHPVASALAAFFADILGLDYDEIMDYHEDGMGFGVIAQACWMSYALEGDATSLSDILAAKKSGDFSSIMLPDGGTAKNWGQFKKAVLSSDRAEKNLGAIMSCCAKGEQERERDKNRDRDRDQDQEQAKDKKGKGPNEEAGGPPAEPPGKSKEEGSGKPDTPPGQDKGGGNDKGGSGGKGKGK
jgi:hypothetical protein